MIIEPVGGLGNRMRVIASAFKCLDKNNYGLVCLWNENAELNAPFYELFERVEGLTIKSKPGNYKRVMSSYQKNPLKKITAKVLNKSAGIDYCIKQKDMDILNHSPKTQMSDICTKYRNIYVQTCEEIADADQDYQRFIPVKSLQLKIDEICRKYYQTIGVHIRRTDNTHAIENSPVELFVDIMGKEISRNDDVTFFLSTDDIQVENNLISLFGKRIIRRDKSMNRITIEGIQDAVIDMYCLSKTDLIYGSYWTSFGEVSARIGNIKFIPVVKDTIDEVPCNVNP